MPTFIIKTKFTKVDIFDLLKLLIQNTEWFVSEQGENPIKTYNTT